jgi:hypothetical protein
MFLREGHLLARCEQKAGHFFFVFRVLFSDSESEKRWMVKNETEIDSFEIEVS